MTRRRVFSAFAVVVTAFAQAPVANDFTAVKTFYESGVDRTGIVGSGLALLHGDEIVFEDFHGQARRTPPQPVDRNTAFHWASITKTFTGISIMQLRDRGLLRLDDPVVKYVPELSAVHDPWGPIDAITIRQVMSHSTGFREATWPWHDQAWQPFEPTEWSQVVAMLPYTDVAFRPGTRYSYSNLAVIFLGRIIQHLTGDEFQIYVDKNILKPLEMYHSYFNRAPYHLLQYRSASFTIHNGNLVEAPFDFDTGITVSNGGLNAPIADMEKYLAFLAGSPEKKDVYNQILKRASLEEMWQPQIEAPLDGEDAAGNAKEKDWLGLSFFIHEARGHKLIGHSGGQNGFISHFYLEPASRRAYIVAYNTDATDTDRNTRRFDRDLRDYFIDHFFRAP